MALSGLEIFKLLPQTNCGDCGVPTCLAFGMKLAQGQAELSACPHVSDEAVAALGAAAAPPMRAVTVGVGDAAFTVGEETVLFRHDKTFVNPTAIGVSVGSGSTDEEIGETVAAANAASFERVQMELRCGFVAVQSTADSARYTAVVEKVAAATELPLILISEDPDDIAGALAVVSERNPLICAANEANADAMISLAKQHGCPLCVRGDDLESVVALTEKADAAGLTDLVINTSPATPADGLRERVFARRAALEKEVQALGYPFLTFPLVYADGDPMLEVVYAAVDVAKYGSIVVLSGAEAWMMLPLLVLRQNIYTDPQRPMQAEAKIYEFGSPGPDAPFFITTNFSLTYFIVSSEIEAAKVPAYLGIVESEGLSVLTAWAAGKFVPERIAKFVNESGMADKIGNREVIIPGAVAQISGELAGELEGWDVTVGPYEAAEIPAFMKQRVG
jgi:acetyl-CoA decarbonylase/synthase complex subunit gamma